MKFIKITFTTGLLLTVCTIHSMDNNKQSYKDATTKKAIPSQTVGPKGRKPSHKGELSSKPRSTSIPEVAKMINIVLALQQQTAILLKEAEETRKQLTELSKLSIWQQELLQAQQTELSDQKKQIATLLVLTKTTYSGFLPSDLLDDAQEKQATNSNSSLESVRRGTWQGDLDRALEEAPDSPNHPRLASSPTDINPWFSPNHPKK